MAAAAPPSASTATVPAAAAAAESSASPDMPPPASLVKPPAAPAAASQDDEAGGAAATPPLQKQQEQQEQNPGEEEALSSSSVAAAMVVEADEPVVPPPPAEGLCRAGGCGKASPYRCMRCGEAFYCSRAHQRADWAHALPHGTRGGHFKECVARVWLPPPQNIDKQVLEEVEKMGGLPPVAGAQGQGEGQGGDAAGEEEGNAAKRAKVGGGRGDTSGNPQAMWSSAAGHPVPGSADAAAMMQTTGFWKDDSGGGGGGGGGTGGAAATQDPLYESLAAGLDMSTSLGICGGGPLGPMSPLRDFLDPSLTQGLNEASNAVAMAAGPLPLPPPVPVPVPEPPPPPEEAVVQLMEMGFEEGDARSALVVHYNNVERALDYLLNSGGGGANGEPGNFDEVAAGVALAGMGNTPVPEWGINQPKYGLP